MQSVNISADLETLYCPVTGVTILHPDLEGVPGLSPAVLLVWDNISCEFTFAAPQVDERFQKFLSAQNADEDGDEDVQEAFERMMDAWNREEDSLLHLCLHGPEVMEFHIVFDLAYND